jgi:hypothetical protein
MALANVAWVLALSGERVLIVDWDLEAPGVHRFFHPFLEDKDLLKTDGLLDFVVRVAGRAAVSETPLEEEDVDVIEYIRTLEWPSNSDIGWRKFGEWAGIDILVAGRQSPMYGQTLNNFNWIDFYAKLGGRRLLNMALKQMQGIYDYILIDSRTGVSDTSGICTVEMPDSLVVCFTLNDQSIKGASGIVDSVLAQRKGLVPLGTGFSKNASSLAVEPFPKKPLESLVSFELDIEGTSDSESLLFANQRPIRIFPVPTRVEIGSERAKREVALTLAQQRFSSLTEGLSAAERGLYWQVVQLPYIAFYAFEEIPAIFGDTAGDQNSLTKPSLQIAQYITGNPRLEIVQLDPDYDKAESLRKSVLDWYLRRGENSTTDCVQLAQSIYDRSDRANQILVQRAALRLVQVVSGSALGVATVPLEDFDPPLDGTIKMFTEAGLTEVSGSSTCFVDKKIVDSWELLRGWVQDRSQWMIWRQALSSSVKSWREHQMDESTLYRGPLLTEALAWMEKYPEDLNQAERNFILEGRKASKTKKVPLRQYSALSLSLMVFIFVLIGAGFLYIRWKDEMMRAKDAEVAAKQEQLNEVAAKQEQLNKVAANQAAMLKEVNQLRAEQRASLELRGKGYSSSPTSPSKAPAVSAIPFESSDVNQVTVRSSFKPTGQKHQPTGWPIYTVQLSLAAPDTILDKTSEVRYHFNHESYHPNPKIGRDRGSAFAISYIGWGCVDQVVITLVPRNSAGGSITLPDFDLCSVWPANKVSPTTDK